MSRLNSRAGPPHRHRRRGPLRDRPAAPRPWCRGQRQRRRRVADARRAARARRDRPRRPRPAAPRPPRRRRHRRGLDSDQARQPRVRRGHRAAPRRDLARRRDGRADGGPPRGRRRRHPRQDHDDVAADHRAAGGGRRPDVHDRRRPRGDRRQRRRGHRRPLRRRGRRERRRLPRPTARTPRSSPTSRPTTSTTGGRGRPTPPAFDEFADTLDPDGFLVCCVDDAGSGRAGRAAAGRGPSGRHRLDPAGPADVGPDALDGVSLWSPGDHYLADALAAYAAGLALGLRRRRPEARPRVVHRHPAADGAQGRGRGSARLRQLCAPPDRDRRRPAVGPRPRRRRAASSWRSSRTWSPGPARSAPRWARRSGRPTRSWSADVYLAREAADPAVTGALVADAVPLPAERVAYVPAVADVAAALAELAQPGDLVLTLGAGDVTEVGPAGAGAAGGARRWLRPEAASRAAGRREPAQPQALRAPPVAAALAGLALPGGPAARRGPARHRRVRRVVLVVARRREGRRERRADHRPPTTSGSAPDIDSGTPLARVDLASAEALVRSLAVVKDVDVSRQWPDTILIEIQERVAIAVVEIGERLRGMDADGVVFRDYNRAPPGLPRVQTEIGTGGRGAARRPRWSSPRCPSR